LSDWHLPRFSGMQALSIAPRANPDLPFVLVTGTIGEEAAVEAMRAGARDFVLKGRFARLIPVVQREVREGAGRSQRRQMQAELERRREEAEHLTRSERLARQRSEHKSKFLASMSHELRTPLNAILGFSDLLLQPEFGPLNERQVEFVANIVDSGRHLLHLVNDLLDLSKIEAGRMTLNREPTAIGVMVDAVRASVQPLADRQGVTLEMHVDDDLPKVDVDPLRLRQILYNLLSNAIKFTPAGGHVKLAAAADTGHVSIAVADTGIGIAAADLPRLFRDFEQIESPNGGKPDGTGLGLALSRRLATMHGGDITVDSAPGRGSTFTVTLPFDGGMRDVRTMGATA
ncbi:MAG TPA: ATP-binding protein, partial [Xanthomonadales bacterium]|nr:ATP-binding protein [Xanthomonadales bacterium]